MKQFDDLRQELARLGNAPVAIDETRSPTFRAVVSTLAEGRDVSDNVLRAMLGPRAAGARTKTVSVVPVAGGNGKQLVTLSMRGIALYGIELQPFCFSTKLLAATVAELAADPLVGKIQIQIDTPGGAVTGTPEAAAAVKQAAAIKPVIGVVDPLCASAGYWIGSQCSDLVAVPSAEIGSVGVFMMHVDYSAALGRAGIKPTFIHAGRHKVEGNPYEPLSADSKQYFQKEIDSTYSQFVATVCAGRDVSFTEARDRFGQGRCLSAVDARRADMVDAIVTPDQAQSYVLSALRRPRAGPRISDAALVEMTRQKLAMARAT